MDNRAHRERHTILYLIFWVFQKIHTHFNYLEVPIFEGCRRSQHLRALEAKSSFKAKRLEGQNFLLVARGLSLFKLLFQSILICNSKIYLRSKSLTEYLHQRAKKLCPEIWDLLGLKVYIIIM